MGWRYEKPRQKLGRKGKSTGYIYIPGSQFCEAEDNLKLRSCSHDSIINSAPRIGNYINKHELYRQ